MIQIQVWDREHFRIGRPRSERKILDGAFNCWPTPCIGVVNRHRWLSLARAPQK